MLDKYNNQKIRQRLVNSVLYISATDMEKATKVKLTNWREYIETSETLLALHKQTGYAISNNDKWVRNILITDVTTINEISDNYLIEVRKGTDKGTWFHEDVAIAYAYNCNVDFRLWVINLVKNALRGNTQKTLPIQIDPSRHVLYRPLEEGKMKWRKTFPDTLYIALFKLDNREVNLRAKPPCMAKYTIKYIYDELEMNCSKAVYKELKVLREENEKLGLRGIGYLHQYLSPEGRTLLDRTITNVTCLIEIAIRISDDPKQRKIALETMLSERRGQLSLLGDGHVIGRIIGDMRRDYIGLNILPQAV